MAGLRPPILNKWDEVPKLFKRVINMDTKINNFLFDKTDEVLALIDFDTLMPIVFFRH